MALGHEQFILYIFSKEKCFIARTLKQFQNLSCYVNSRVKSFQKNYFEGKFLSGITTLGHEIAGIKKNIDIDHLLVRSVTRIAYSKFYRE